VHGLIASVTHCLASGTLVMSKVAFWAQFGKGQRQLRQSEEMMSLANLEKVIEARCGKEFHIWAA